MTHPGTDPSAQSILARLQTTRHDPDATAAYEVTVDLLRQVVAIFSARRWQQEHAEEPDADALEEAVRLQGHYARLLQDLNADDRVRVVELDRECVSIIRQAEAKQQ